MDKWQSRGITNIVNKKGNSNISVYEYSYYLDGSDACKTRNENGITQVCHLKKQKQAIKE